MSAKHGFALVGRDAELAAIAAFLGTPDGDLGGVVFRGQMGIGKTALIQATMEEARDREIRVLVTTPGPREASVSFSGLEDLFRDTVDETAPALPDPQRRALEVALEIRDPEGEPPGALAVALAVRGTLAALARERPVLVVVDDAQWLDGPTARALSHALRRVSGNPVRFIASADADPRAGEEPELLLGLAPDLLHSIHPAPLSRDETGELVRSRLGVSLTRGELIRLHQACGGNPLFALEVVRGLPPGRGLPAGEPVPIPGDLGEVVRRRLAETSNDVQQTLLLLATAGDHEVEAELSSAGVSAAIEAGILERADERVRFVHPMYAAVVVADAPVDERRAAHRRLATIVEDPEARARHLALAADGPDAESADALEAAATAARRRGAPSSGAELAEMAAGLTPGDRTDEIARRRLRASDLHLDAGEFDRARTLLEGVLASAPAGPVRAAALQRLGWVRYHQDSWIAAAELFREAAGEAADDPAMLAAIELDASVVRLLSGDVQAASIAARSALDRALVSGDEPTVAAARAMVASVEFLLGNGVAEDVLVGAVEVETWSRPRPTMQRSSVALGVLLKWAGELGRARSLLVAARRRAEEEGTERSLPFILFHLADLECWSGNWTEAAASAKAAREIAERTGQEGGLAYALAAGAQVAALRGSVEVARKIAAAGLRLAHQTGSVPATIMIESALGQLELSLGDAAAALRNLGPLAEAAAQEGIHEPGAVRFVGDAIESLIGVGDLEHARELTETLRARSDVLDRTWGIAVAARSRALLYAAEGDLASAQQALDEALAEHDRLSEPFERARTLLALGRVRRRDRQKRTAREALETGLDAFQMLGAEQWAARTREELERIGGRAASSVSLTPAEERIARMAAGGATNQEIARALYLAPKTVEWNLTRIYLKLGIRNRVELARWVDAPDAPI